MTRKGFISLLLLTLAVIAAAAFFVIRQNQGQAPTTGTKLFPALEAKVNDLNRLHVRNGGETPSFELTVNKDGEQWTIEQRWGWPADIGRLRRTLLSLTNVEQQEPKTRNAKRYEKLGVQDIADSGPENHLLQVFAGEQQLAEVLIGGNSPQGNGSYVRKPGDEQSWLASESLKPSVQFSDWLAKDLTDISKQRLQSVKVTPLTGKGYTIDKDSAEATSFVLQGVPKGREASAGSVSRVVAVIENLKLEDVVAGKTYKVGGDWARAVFTTFDGLVVELLTQESEDKKRLARFNISFNAEQAAHHAEAEKKAAAAEAEAMAKAKADAEAEGKPAPAPAAPKPSLGLLTAEQAKAEAEVLAKYLHGWTFQIQQYKADFAGQTLENMLKPLPEPEEKTAKPKRR